MAKVKRIATLGRTLKEVMDSLPKDRQRRIQERYRELKNEVESLKELRAAVGKAQAEIAAVLKIKQPSVSKLERQADMYLSTLRKYIEAIGGDLELVVHLPSRQSVRLNSLADVFPLPAAAPRKRAQLRAKAPAAKRRALVKKP